MSDRKEIFDMFIRGMSGGIPGKARYENFQLAVNGRLLDLCQTASI